METSGNLQSSSKMAFRCSQASSVPSFLLVHRLAQVAQDFHFLLQTHKSKKSPLYIEMGENWRLSTFRAHHGCLCPSCHSPPSKAHLRRNTISAFFLWSYAIFQEVRTVSFCYLEKDTFPCGADIDQVQGAAQYIETRLSYDLQCVLRPFLKSHEQTSVHSRQRMDNRPQTQFHPSLT